MPIRLRPHVNINIKDSLIIISTEKDLYRIKTTHAPVRNTAQQLQERKSAITFDLNSTPDSKIRHFLEFLIDNDLTYEDKPDIKLKTRDICEKQIFYFATKTNFPASAQISLEQASVAIVGVGGTGAVVLQHLVGAGVKRFTLIDHDTVSVSNINRQFIYHRDDIGQPKVDVAVRYINHRVNGAVITPVYERVGDSYPPSELLDSITHCDLFVVAFDKPTHTGPSKFLAECWLKRRAAIFGAVGADVGFTTPVFSPNDGSNKPYAAPVSFSPTRHSPPDYSFGPINTSISAEIARKSILHLTRIANPSIYNHYTVHRFHEFPTVAHMDEIAWTA